MIANYNNCKDDDLNIMITELVECVFTGFKYRDNLFHTFILDLDVSGDFR